MQGLNSQTVRSSPKPKSRVRLTNLATQAPLSRLQIKALGGLNIMTNQRVICELKGYPSEDSLNSPQFLCEPLVGLDLEFAFALRHEGSQGLRGPGERASRTPWMLPSSSENHSHMATTTFSPFMPYHFSLHPSLYDLLPQTLQVYSCFTALVFVVSFAWNALSPDLCLTSSFISFRTQLKW